MAVVLAAGGCSSAPEPTSGIPSLQPVALPGGAVGFARATLAGPLIPRLGDGPDGPQFVSQPDGHPQPLEMGRRVVLLGEPEPGPDGPWVRVWVEPSSEAWPGDFYGWLPANRPNRTILNPVAPATCPNEATIQTLAPLVQQDRLRCVGKTEITIEGRTGQLGRVPFYDVNPAWYGTNAGPPILAMFDPGPIRFGPGATLGPDAAGAWIEPQVPPAVAPLPLGLFVRVTGHFDDPSAATCRRAEVGGFPGMPVEAAADSVQWCREQFVVTSWQVLLGAEGRPIDVRDPQLHRREFRVPPGVLLACGGVGMQPLTIRIDPSQADPVWIESGPNRFRSQAVFGNEFRLFLDPVRVQATTGVTLVNGELIDPDRGKPGLELCPAGETIWFDVPPG